MLNWYVLFWFVVKALVVSFPEALTGVYIAFLLLGLTKFLPYICDRVDFKTNVHRLLFFSAIYAVSFELMRLFVPVPIMSLPLKIAVVMVSLKYIYKIEWKDAIFSFLIMFMFLMAVEPLVVSQVLNILKVSLDSWVKNSNYTVIFGSLAVRIVGLITIASFWNLKIVRDDLTDRRKPNRERTIQLIVFLLILIFFEMIYVDNVLSTFCIVPTIRKILSVIGCIFS